MKNKHDRSKNRFSPWREMRKRCREPQSCELTGEGSQERRWRSVGGERAEEE